MTTEITEDTEEKNRDHLNRVTDAILGAAIAVHKEIGPGLLESVYEACLAYELRQRGLRVEQQKPLPVKYKDVELDIGYRLDLVVEDSVAVELKSVQGLKPIHTAQIISYLKLSGYELGRLINFNVRLLKNGVKRYVND